MEAKRQLLHESNESLIYLQEHPEQGKQVLKVLRANEPSMDQLLQFKSEYQYTNSLNMEGIRKAIKHTKEGMHTALVLEWVEGCTLDKAFVKSESFIEDTLDAFAKIAEVLGKMHEKGIIHKDINTQNILWKEEEKKPVIIDFGISNQLDLTSHHLKNPINIKGTLTHMSPEQTGRVNRKIDNRSDLYAFGITIFEVLTGKLPYESGDSLELVHFHITRSIPLAHRLNPDIPDMISKIVAKLMSKNPEDRYRTAFGLKYDLEKCLTQWQKWRKIEEFKLGEKDFSSKFIIPQKLYGRYDEIKTMLKAFQRISMGSTEMLLIAGYSGVGKSALISELYKPITEKRGYLASGKFEQYQRNIPYYPIIQAFTEFCNYLLTEKKETLARWKDQLSKAIGDNGQVLIDIIPALEQIIGPQPEVAQLEAQEALNRFNLVFQSFIRTISQPHHPFVLFIDDLQWADAASLNLIRILISDLRNPYFLVIGAYRDNEINPGHPLLQMLTAAREEKAVITNVKLNPLREEHLYQLVRDTLQIDEVSSQDLSELIYSKTRGNAFFTIEFLRSLKQRELVFYDYEHHVWQVKLDEIRKMGITENVVDLLVAKIEEMPAVTQDALKVASCIGGFFDLQLLSVLYGKNIRESMEDLWMAITEELLIPLDDQYQLIDLQQEQNQLKVEIEFAHDRVQQAAYSLMVSEYSQRRHLQIGRILLERQKNSQISLFDVVNHLNKGCALIEDEEEKFQLLLLNLDAATQAKKSSAFQSALDYVNGARELANDLIWDKDYKNALRLYKTAADIEYLNGHFDESESLIQYCLEKAQSPTEKSDIYFMLMQNQNNRTRYYEAIDSARIGLGLLDFTFPEDDYEKLIPGEMEKVIAYFTAHGVESVFAKENMRDQRMLSIMNILDNLSPPTYVSGETYAWILHVLFKINLTVEYGLTPQGAYAFAELALIFFIQNNYEYAYPSALLSKKMAEKFKQQSPRHLSRTGHLFTNYSTPWVRHIRETNKLNPEYYQISLDSGELIYAGYTSFFPFYNAFYQGEENLESLLDKVPEALSFTKNIKHDLAHDSLRALQMAITYLHDGSTPEGSFDLPEMTESDFLAYCEKVKDAYGSTMFFLLKAFTHHLLGNIQEALEYLERTDKMQGVISGNAPQDSTFKLTYALTLIQLLEEKIASPEEVWPKVELFKEQLKVMAGQNASNFEHKYFLVEAEMARFKNDDLAAIEYYRKALHSAEQHCFEREIAFIHQKAATFWLKNDNPLYATSHLEKARYLFETLGYHRLVNHIDQTYWHLIAHSNKVFKKNQTQTITTRTATAEIENLDTISVIKAAGALSEEIVLDKLLDKMLRISIESAGGQRAVLLLQEFSKWVIVADLNEEKYKQVVIGSREMDDAEDIPLNVINYVIRTRNEVISLTNDTLSIFERDQYLRKAKPASYLCLPLIHKGETSGILYMEHQTINNVFTDKRLNILRLLNSQMAVSLENANLYKRQIRLNEANQRFVPLDFIKALDRDSILQVNLGDHIQQKMHVMFCDIRSYSTMSEHMTASENFIFLNEYLKKVGPIIRKNHGFINHYLGDGFIALFKDDAEDALKAAIGILTEMKQHNLKRESEGEPPILLGFGIHSGEVMMGIIGDEERHDASVISDAVNTSSRLEGLTKIFGASIILSDKTLNELEDKNRFEFRYLGRIQVKGKEEIQNVYEMFSSDHEITRARKFQTLDIYNQGIKDYFDKKFAEAALSFRKVLDINSMDKTARMYLQKSANYMVDGVSDQWNGVEAMIEK